VSSNPNLNHAPRPSITSFRKHFRFRMNGRSCAALTPYINSTITALNWGNLVALRRLKKVGAPAQSTKANAQCRERYHGRPTIVSSKVVLIECGPGGKREQGVLRNFRDESVENIVLCSTSYIREKARCNCSRLSERRTIVVSWSSKVVFEGSWIVKS
jgi:hypothetical protein